MTWLWVLLAVYAFVVVAMFLAQRSLIYPAAAIAPQLADQALPALRAIETEPEPGLRLTHWYHPPAGEREPLIVFFHGNGSDLANAFVKMRPFIDAGFGLLATGYRGYSGNPGRPSEAGLTADARSVIDWAAAEGYGRERLVYYGESLGTAVAVKLASERPPSALVLEAPPSSIADVAAAHYWYLPVRLLIRDPWDSLSRIAEVRAPLLIMHGERDRVVPARFGRRLFAAAAEPKQAIWHAEALHTNILSYPGVVEDVLAFIRARSLTAAR
ncbi:MAG TPA: alpha/beta hydrolase [Kiloniellaceae bacterium]